jgi:hypothetical protein
MAYYQFQDEMTSEGYGSCEVFYTCGSVDVDGDIEPGWYWNACFPGCMPDGEAIGPFETEALAMADADVVA